MALWQGLERLHAENHTGLCRMAEKARLLRAMVFADIVGYSALIAEDEDGALDLVGDYLNLFQDYCTSNGGEIVQVRDDGVFDVQ